MIRPGTLADLAAILAIERNSEMAAHWGEDAYIAILEGSDPSRFLLVAEDLGQVAGFAVARQVADESELENIVIAPSSRGKGLGTRLLRSGVAIARSRGAQSLHAEARESNGAINGFYKPLGFRETGRRPNYYHSPVEDAILLCLPCQGGSP